jgi:hypothetical protein
VPNLRRRSLLQSQLLRSMSKTDVQARRARHARPATAPEWHAPQPLLEALAHQLRDGPAALGEASARRISQLSELQAKNIASRLTKERWSYDGRSRVPPWSAHDIEGFVEVWKACHG